MDPIHNADTKRRLPPKLPTSNKRQRGETIHTKAENGDLAGVKKQIENGSSVTEQDILNHEMPLSSAARGGSLKVVEWLADKNSSTLDQPNKWGYTAMEIAAQSGHFNIVKFLAERGSTIFNPSSLYRALDSKNLDIISWLVQSGNFDIDRKEFKAGTTILHRASQKNSLDVIKFLVIECGADINVISPQGTAIQIAAEKNRADLVAWFVEYGANIHTLVLGSTPLLEAALYKSLDVATWLVQHANADIFQQTSDGQTLADQAAIGGGIDMIKWLLNLVPIKNKFWGNALVNAVENNQ
jgi:ankyrin repeat protein